MNFPSGERIFKSECLFQHIQKKKSNFLPVPRLMSSTSQINGKLNHVRHGGREYRQDVEKVHGPDIPVMALMIFLSETKFGSRCLKLGRDDHRNQRWNLSRKWSQSHSRHTAPSLPLDQLIWILDFLHWWNTRQRSLFFICYFTYMKLCSSRICFTGSESPREGSRL